MSSFLLNVPTWAYLYFKDLSYSDFFTHNGLKFFMKNYYNVLSHSDFFNFFLGKYFLNFQNIKSFMKKSNYILTDNAKSDQLPWVILMFNFHNILCNNKFLVKIISSKCWWIKCLFINPPEKISSHSDNFFQQIITRTKISNSFHDCEFLSVFISNISIKKTYPGNS